LQQILAAKSLNSPVFTLAATIDNSTTAIWQHAHKH